MKNNKQNYSLEEEVAKFLTILDQFKTSPYCRLSLEALLTHIQSTAQHSERTYKLLAHAYCVQVFSFVYDVKLELSGFNMASSWLEQFARQAMGSDAVRCEWMIKATLQRCINKPLPGQKNHFFLLYRLLKLVTGMRNDFFIANSSFALLDCYERVWRNMVKPPRGCYATSLIYTGGVLGVLGLAVMGIAFEFALTALVVLGLLFLLGSATVGAVGLTCRVTLFEKKHEIEGQPFYSTAAPSEKDVIKVT